MRNYETIAMNEPARGVLEITLLRPKQLNALSELLVDELLHVISELKGSLAGQYQAAIIRGSGRAFSSGGDIKDFLTLYEQDITVIENYIAKFSRLAQAWYELPLPTIASIHGNVAGGGASLALASDIRIAAEDTQIQFIFSRIGLIPDMGAHYLLPKTVGEARSLELLYSGRPVPSEEALRIGLVHQVVPNDRLQDQSVAYASQYLQGAIDVYRKIKQLVKGHDRSVDQILNLETVLQAERFKSAELKEFVQHFFEEKKG